MEDRVDLGDWLHTEMVYPPQTVTHPITNPAVHGWESNLRPVDHKSNAVATTQPSHLSTGLLQVLESPAGGAYSTPPDHLAGFEGAASPAYAYKSASLL